MRWLHHAPGDNWDSRNNILRYMFRESFMKQFSLCSILRNTATNYFKRSNTNKWGSQTYLQAEVCREKRSFLFCLTASSQRQYVEQEAWQDLQQSNNYNIYNNHYMCNNYDTITLPLLRGNMLSRRRGKFSHNGIIS